MFNIFLLIYPLIVHVIIIRGALCCTDETIFLRGDTLVHLSDPLWHHHRTWHILKLLSVITQFQHQLTNKYHNHLRYVKYFSMGKSKVFRWGRSGWSSPEMCVCLWWIKAHLDVGDVIIFTLNGSVEFIFQSCGSFQHRPEHSVYYNIGLILYTLYPPFSPSFFILSLFPSPPPSLYIFSSPGQITHFTSFLVNSPTLSSCSSTGIRSSVRCCTKSAILYHSLFTEWRL